MASAAIGLAEESRLSRSRFVATIFAGSFLLFLVQPMIGRMALPRLGGAPAVWTSAMLVYQALLLAGYAYAHWLGRFAPRTQAALHLGVFALAGLMLPLGLIGATPPPNANSFIWVPWLLAVSIGPLFFVIAAQAPLIQRWFACSAGGDPYPLYAASNLGSFTGLLAYPLLLEPLMPIISQRYLWSVGYVMLALFVMGCAWGLPRIAVDRAMTAPTLPRPAARTIAAWIGLAIIPSGLMLSTTLHLSTDILAMPLLWVVPLGLYLLSFSVAFADRRWLAALCKRIAPFTLLLAACGVFVDTTQDPIPFAIAALLNLFVLSVALHAQLFDRRPEPAQLTSFYLAMSVGGVIGGLICALAAPMLFDWTYEHPLLMVAGAVTLAATNPFERFVRLWSNSERTARLTRWAPVLLLLLSLVGQGAFGLPNSKPLAVAASMLLIFLAIVAIGQRWIYAACVGALMLSMSGWDKFSLSVEPGKMTRSFFGNYSILSRDEGARMLVHGTTIHGIQLLGNPQREIARTSYYAPGAGVGLAMEASPALFGPAARIGVVGLGAGTLACYARPNQSWIFYEIDPAVVKIARDASRFTFLQRCLPDAPMVIGDARLTVSLRPASSADLLVVDAFSSDSVPMHLLTLEAFETYRRHLDANGLLMVHISNRYLALEPVIAAAAQRGWAARLRHFVPNKAERALQQNESVWIALSPSARTIAALEAQSPQGAWRPLQRRPGFRAWTDDHASILPIIK